MQEQNNSSKEQLNEEPTNIVEDETTQADPVASQEKGAQTESTDLAESKELLAEEKEEDLETIQYVCKLNEKQQRIWQIVLGWIFGFLIWFSLAIGAMFQENKLLGWLFVVIFAIAMFGRTAIERKTGVTLRIFMKHFLISLLVFLVVFVLVGPVFKLLPVF